MQIKYLIRNKNNYIKNRKTMQKKKLKSKKQYWFVKAFGSFGPRKQEKDAININSHLVSSSDVWIPNYRVATLLDINSLNLK